MTTHTYHGITFRKVEGKNSLPNNPWIAEHGPYRIVVYKNHEVPFGDVYRLDPSRKEWSDSSLGWIGDVCLLNGVVVEGRTMEQMMENAAKATLEHEKLHGPTFDNAINIPAEDLVVGDLFHHKGRFGRVEAIWNHESGHGWKISVANGLHGQFLWITPGRSVTIAQRKTPAAAE